VKCQTLVYPDGQEILRELVNISVTPEVGFTFGTAYFPAGTRVPEEGLSAHSGFEVSLMIAGELDVFAGGVTTRLKAGDLVNLPPGEEHHSTALTDVKLIYVQVGKP
jgi:quercetin dioxygenase-like cupin family protein